MSVTYDLKKTDQTKTEISVNENTRVSNLVDIVLFGYKELEYGRELNENILHILENFSCPEDPSNPGNPDTSRANYGKLDGRQIEGQFWYNTTKSQLNFWDGSQWVPLSNLGEDIAANWGQILHGEQLPRPQSVSGYLFPYEECSWIVSPFNQAEGMENMICRTDEVATVQMTYIYDGDVVETNAIANYLIVGIRDNNNLGTQIPVPSALPSPTPSPTPSSTPGVTPTPPPSEFAFPTPTPTPSPDFGTLRVTFNVSKFLGSCSTASSFCAASDTVSALEYNITGGSGDYDYLWQWAGVGTAFSVVSGTTATPTFTRNAAVGSTYSGTGILTVTDNVTGQTTSRTFTFETTHSSTALPTPTPVPPTPTPVPPTPTPVPPTPTPVPPTPSSVPPTPSSVPPTPEVSPSPIPPSPSPVAPLEASVTSGGCDTVQNPFLPTPYLCSPPGTIDIIDSVTQFPLNTVSVTGGQAPYTLEIISATAGSSSPVVQSLNASTNGSEGTLTFSVIGPSGRIDNPLTFFVEGGYTVQVTDNLGSTTTVGVTCRSTLSVYCNNVTPE